MGAPKGNNFWALRSKHGRDKIFESPDLMWEAACEYFQWCQDNPLIEEDYLVIGIGKGQSVVEKVEKNKMRAFTIHGLCHYLSVNTDYFTDFKDGLKGKIDEQSKDFSRVITHVYEVVYNQKFTGAAANLLNSNIIARDLKLTDKSEHTVIPQSQDLSSLTEEELAVFIAIQEKINGGTGKVQ